MAQKLWDKNVVYMPINCFEMKHNSPWGDLGHTTGSLCGLARYNGLLIMSLFHCWQEWLNRPKQNSCHFSAVWSLEMLSSIPRGKRKGNFLETRFQPKKVHTNVRYTSLSERLTRFESGKYCYSDTRMMNKNCDIEEECYRSQTSVAWYTLKDFECKWLLITK